MAVFGLGDQISYAENYADAAGELYDVFLGLGCDMVSYAATSQDGYEHKASKSIRGGLFCGLLLDQINQDELTSDRVSTWVAQLKAGGFVDGGTLKSSSDAAKPPAAADPPSVDTVVGPSEEDRFKERLEQSSVVLDHTIDSHASGGFTPHYNPITGKIMWTSPDGRSSYVTTVETETSLLP